MTTLGTDIEQSIRNAIAETLGEMRFEMWFGNQSKIEITDKYVRIYAVNTFAADWVEKNYMSVVFDGCRRYLETPRNIEIVSPENDDKPVLMKTVAKTVREHETPENWQGLLVAEKPFYKSQDRLQEFFPKSQARELRFGNIEAAVLEESFNNSFDESVFLPKKITGVSHTKDRYKGKGIGNNKDALKEEPIGVLKENRSPVLMAACHMFYDSSTSQDNSDIRDAGPCESQVVLPIQKPTDKITKKNKTTQSKKNVKKTKSKSGDTADVKNSELAVKPERQEARNNNRMTACRRLTPQEINERIITNGKEKLADMTSNQPMQNGSRHSSVKRPPDAEGTSQRKSKPQATVVRAAVTQTNGNSATPNQQFFNGLEVGRDVVAKKTHDDRMSGKSTVSTSVERNSRNQNAASKPMLQRDASNRNVVVLSSAKGKRSSLSGQSVATLERFVVGPSNRLAVRTAELAVNHSGQISPIYIFGPTSVGKTHLLESIRAGLRRSPQGKPVVLMTAEQFTSAFIDGLKQGIPLFRNKFRGISALLVDDIQFFAGKESTQTEFLRTIDQLKNQGVQIVLTGDRPLNALVDLLKPEIVSRMEAGMHCEIKQAEYETLLAIFKQMAMARNLKLTDEVCEYVVSRLTTHARQLSGAVNRLHAAVLTTGKSITPESVETLLEDMIRNNRRAVRLQDIDKAVCETLQLSGQLLQSNSRAKLATQPRMLAMWLARKYTRSALSEIGRYFGNRSHSTVVSAQKKVDHWLQESPDLGLAGSSMPIAEIIQKVERMLQTR